MVAFPCRLATGQAALDLCFCLLPSVSAAERRSSNSLQPQDQFNSRIALYG